jgi:hypothetical protein
MRVFRPIVDCPVEAVRLDLLLARADARAYRCLSLLDTQTRLIGTETLQSIRIGIGSGKCRPQRRGLTRNFFCHVHEMIEVALVGTRPFRHPSGAIVDLCEMF